MNKSNKVKFLATELDGTITIHQVKHGRPAILGSLTRTKKTATQNVKELANIFLTTFKHIPENWTKTDGSINEQVYGNKYEIYESANEL